MMRSTGIALSLLLILAVGCAPSDKSPELLELEGMLQAPEAQQIREIPNAARFHQEARQYRRASEDARQDRRDERSEEYAILGLIRYRTALAVARQFDEASKLQEANERLEAVNPVLRETSQARNELAREVRELDDAIRAAVREQDEARRRDEARTLQTQFEARQASGDGVSAEVLREINAGIDEARRLRDQGLEVRADEWDRTRVAFQRATDQLENARTLLSNEPAAAESVRRQVAFSVQLFQEALDTARPIHEEELERMRPENRIATLQREARNNFGQPFTEEEPNGVRIVLARLFVRGEAEYQRNTETQLQVLKRLVTEYEEFSVEIQGFTQRRGNATNNLTTSQLRALRVRELLEEEGVSSSRIRTSGLGQDQIRFPDAPDNNDRVEVILRHTRP